MTILLGESTKAVHGTLKTYETVIQPEQYAIDPIDLPLTKPGSPQYVFTVSDSNRPYTIPEAVSIKNIPWVYVAGTNLSGSSAVINVEYSKNGVVINTLSNSSVPSTQYWTGSWASTENNAANFLGSVDGDIFSFKAWASVPGVKLEYYALFIVPSRIITKHSYVSDVMYTLGNASNIPLLTRTPIVSGWTGSFYVYAVSDHAVNPSDTTGGAVISQLTGKAFPVLRFNPTTGSGICQGGDMAAGISGIYTSNINKLQLTTNNFQTRLSFRELLR